MDDLPPPPYTPMDSNHSVTSSDPIAYIAATIDHITGDASQSLAPMPTTLAEEGSGHETTARPKLKPNPDLGHALHAAVVKGDVPMINTLLQHGACANTRPTTKKPALVIAVERGDCDTVRKILEHSEPDLEAKAPGGATALYTAVSRGEKEIVQLLLAHGANPNAKPSGSQPALFKAYKNGYKEIVNIMLEAPSLDVNATPPGGTSILWHAAEAVDREILQLLLGHGAKVDLKPPGQATAMYRAAVRGDLHTAESLLGYGAKVDAKPPGGSTALWQAADQGNQAIVRLLLAHGANVNAKPAGSETALTRATKKGNSDMVRLLLEYC